MNHRVIPIQPAPAAAAPVEGVSCSQGADQMRSEAERSGKAEVLAQYDRDYPRLPEQGPHDQPQSMCPAFGSLRVGLRMRRTATILSGSACCVYGLTFTSHFYGARRSVGYVPFNSETLVTGQLFEDIRRAVHEQADPARLDAIVVINLCVPTASGVPLQLLPKEINGVRIIGIDVPGFGIPTHAEAKDVLAGAMLAYARQEAESGPVQVPRNGRAGKPTVTLVGEVFPADPVGIGRIGRFADEPQPDVCCSKQWRHRQHRVEPSCTSDTADVDRLSNSWPRRLCIADDGQVQHHRMRLAKPLLVRGFRQQQHCSSLNATLDCMDERHQHAPDERRQVGLHRQRGSKVLVHIPHNPGASSCEIPPRQHHEQLRIVHHQHLVLGRECSDAGTCGAKRGDPAPSNGSRNRNLAVLITRFRARRPRRDRRDTDAGVEERTDLTTEDARIGGVVHDGADEHAHLLLLPGRQVLFVHRQHIRRWAVGTQHTALHPNATLRRRCDCCGIVIHHEDRASLFLDLLDAVFRLLAEPCIPGTERFIDEQNLRSTRSRDGELQSCAHTARVGLHRQMNAVLQAGHRHRLRIHLLHLVRRAAQGQQSESKVARTAQLRHEDPGDREHRGRGCRPHLAGRRSLQTREHPDEAGLPGPIGADEADGLTATHGERHVLHRMDGLSPTHHLRKHPSHTRLSMSLCEYAVVNGDVARNQDGLSHCDAHSARR